MAMKHAFWLAVPLLVAAAPGQDAPKPYAQATLVVREGGTPDAKGVYQGGTFRSVDHFDPPASHARYDTLIAFEGPGWESDKIGYRLYLDERNVPDIYGKKLPGPVLGRIGQGIDDYSAMADWGMDIFKVNDSLGIGGIGVWRGEKATQLGRSRVSAAILNAPGRATVKVTSLGFAGDGGPADMVATYSLAAGSRVTQVEADVTGNVPHMVAGIIHNPATVMVEGEAGRWHYIGTWGNQSLAHDGLGIVLFYRSDETMGAMIGGDNISIAFCDPNHLRYAFAAAWVQEPGAPKTAVAFGNWAKSEAAALDRADKVPATDGCNAM
jgi:hypothetical protein